MEHIALQRRQLRHEQAQAVVRGLLEAFVHDAHEPVEVRFVALPRQGPGLLQLRP